MQYLKHLFPVLIATIIVAVVPAGAILAQDEDVYSIVVNPTEIASGQEVEITFTTPDTSDNSRDWIGLYHADDPSDQWLDWQFTDESTAGSVTFTVTEAPGDYEFRYGKHFERVFVATSNVVTVTEPDPGEYTLIAAPEQIIGSGEITISFTTPETSNNSKDWIGLYAAGDPSDQWLDWQFTDESTAGSVTFTVDQPAGDYEFRYGKHFERVFVATSNVVTIKPPEPEVYTLEADPNDLISGEQVAVTFTTPEQSNNDQDWIGLYHADDPSDQWLDWQFTDESTAGSVTFTVDQPAGDYEFRYGKNFTRTFVATSNVVIVTGPEPEIYTLIADPTEITRGEDVTVSFTTPDTSDNSRDWIGLYHADDPSDQWLDWQFTDESTAGSVTFTVTEAPGDYEFRYGKNFTRTFVATSNVVTVTGGPGDGDPFINTLTPAEAEAGQPVIVYGSGFSEENNIISLSSDEFGITHLIPQQSFDDGTVTFFDVPRFNVREGSWEVQLTTEQDLVSNRLAVDIVDNTDCFLIIFCNPTHIYTALGDSVALGASALQGYVPLYEDYIEADNAGVIIDLENNAVSGATSAEVLASLIFDPAVRSDVAEAKVITVNVGGNDLRAARDAYRDQTCGGADNQNCIRSAVDDFTDNWTAIINAIQSLRDDDSVVRSMDVYYPYVNEDLATDSWPGDGTTNDFQVFKPYVDEVNQHIASVLFDNQINFAQIYLVFNGPNGTIDPADQGFISLDGFHPNGSGHRVIADQLRQLGYNSTP